MQGVSPLRAVMVQLQEGQAGSRLLVPSSQGSWVLLEPLAVAGSLCRGFGTAASLGPRGTLVRLWLNLGFAAFSIWFKAEDVSGLNHLWPGWRCSFYV